MNKKNLKTRCAFIAGLLGCVAMPAHAEDSNKEETPKDKAIITIFSDIHSGFGHVNDDRGFNLDRAYLGYQYDLSKELQLKVVADFGQSKSVDDHQRIGFVKNAQISWKREKWTLHAGLISTTQFKFQESFWGKRYVMKSFQDEYKFGSSADLAVSAAYDFNDYVSADVILANGEGYKKLQVKDGLQYGAGVTLMPVKNLFIRLYGSYNEASEESGKGITNLASFIGYKHKSFSLAAEYNYQKNASYTDGQDQSGVSAYATVNLSKKVGVFGRWDYLTSKNKWNEENDGMAGLVGAEFRLGKYIKLSPNFRIWSPKAGSMPNSYYAYLNASFSL